MFPTNQDLADILGRTNFDSESFHFLDYRFPDCWISKFLKWAYIQLGESHIMHKDD